MPLKIKLDDSEFTLSNECLVAMATTLWRTKVKERGFMLCQDTEITPTPEHIGGPGSIHVKNCGYKPPTGWYHTHAAADTRPSWLDALTTISMSVRQGRPVLACRGGKFDEAIRCDTLRVIPPRATLDYLRRQRKEKWGTAEDYPEIWRYFAEPYSFPARKVPEIIKPPVPAPIAPRIKTEELVFAGSAFTRYTNLDTGEVRVERLY